MAVITAELEKAISRLEDALKQPKDEFIRDSVIQRFEFCIELSWKTARKVMGTQAAVPKDVVREMAKAGYIDQPELWLEAIDMRNLSSHTYKEDLAEKVFAFIQKFAPNFKTLLQQLNAK